MTGLMSPPQYFTRGEWIFSNNQKFRSAEREREASQGLQQECDRLIEETARRTERTLNDVNRKLDQRIIDVKYWKSELNKKLDDVTNETDALNSSFIRLKKAFEATEEPLHITQECLALRGERNGIDLVHDDAQKEMIKEREVYKGVQALLQKTIEQTKEQMRLNRKAIYNLKNDAANKITAQNIDEYARSLKRTDESIPGSTQPARIESNSFTTEDWQLFTKGSIDAADKQLQNSNQLRSLIDGILQQVASDQTRQVEATNRELRKRIAETRSSKGKLEEHLAEVLKEISNIEDTIVEVDKAIKDKEGALKLAGTRIDIRNTRPQIEFCRDPANYRLVQEVDEIINDVAQLHHRLKLAHNSLKGLCRRQLDLEEEIQIKAATLFIDEVQCMGMRESLKISAY